MAPIRRYLRITKYSVLEVRIYLDNPSLAYTWLLNPRDPALPRIIQAVRPYVLPKLWEEKEKSKAKGKKPQGIKDVAAGDDFEVSIFLTDISTRHSLLTKQKTFQSKKRRIKSNSGKLTSWLSGTNDDPVPVEDEDDNSREDGNKDNNDVPVIIREESDEEEDTMRLDDYPEASDDEGFQAPVDENEAKAATTEENDDDKKKLGLNTSYDGFSIYGKILCLVVKRKGAQSKSSRPDGMAGGGMLENWVSTQAEQDQLLGPDD